DRLPYEQITAADGTPRLRSGGPNEVWSFGEEVQAILVRYLHLREQLRPYLREVMAAAHTDGQPVMRGLIHEFPADPAVWQVVVAGARERQVYLPQGARWTDAATGQTSTGGRTVRTAAPLDVLPVFLRDDALAHLVGCTAARTSAGRPQTARGEEAEDE